MDDYIHTIYYTHYQANMNPRLGLNSAILEDAIIIEEYEEEIYLPPLLELKSMLVILFKYVKREVAFELIQAGLEHNDVTQDIFELCLLQDEEISMYSLILTL